MHGLADGAAVFIRLNWDRRMIARRCGDYGNAVFTKKPGKILWMNVGETDNEL